MGLTNNPTPTNTTPDSDNDTPPHTQPIRPFSSTKGASNDHHYHHQQQQPPPHAAVAYCYRECLKNHAANIGGRALDGCGEFMASLAASPADPTSLTCVACGCHRNFHRRCIDDYNYAPFITTMTPHLLHLRHHRRQLSSSPSPQPPQQPPLPPHMLLALSTAAHDDQQVPNHYQVATPVTPRDAKVAENLSGRKRFRTKFRQDQKEKMHSFAEKMGWKIQKCDKTKIENFCNEIGVPRVVLKVWMHNNKNTFGRKDIIHANNQPTSNMEEDNNNIGNDGGIIPENGHNTKSGMNNINDDENSGNHCNNESGDVNLDQNINNGSSSSS